MFHASCRSSVVKIHSCIYSCIWKLNLNRREPEGEQTRYFIERFKLHEVRPQEDQII